MTGMRGTREGLLTDLLAEIATPDDFRRFVRVRPDGGWPSQLLPENVTSRTVAAEIVDLPRRHRLLDRNFFGRLLDFRPARAEAIGQLEELRFTLSESIPTVLHGRNRSTDPRWPP